MWAHYMHIELLKMASFLRLISVTAKKVKKNNLKENVTDNYKFSEAYFASSPKCICTTYRVMSGSPLTESKKVRGKNRLF